MSKKIFSFLLVFVLLFGTVFAEEQSIALKLFDSVKALLFETENVTTAAEAQLYLDGKLFKSVHASYKQDSDNSLLVYMLDTPTSSGVYTGGYTVVANGEKGYSNDTYYGNYYSETYVKPETTLLTEDARTTLMLNSMRAFISLFPDLFDSIFTENDIITLKCGKLPDLLNQFIYVTLADKLNERYYYTDIYAAPAEDLQIYYDYYDLYVGLYLKLFNEEMPESFFDLVNDGSDALSTQRYGTLYYYIAALEEDIRSKYNSGYVVIEDDGGYTWYSDESAYMLSNGYAYVDYEDIDSVFTSYCENVYGVPEYENLATLMMLSNNDELIDLYYTLWEEVDAYYCDLAAANNAVYAYVNSDGSIDYYAKLPDFTGTLTVTREIATNVKFAYLTDCTADITLIDEHPESFKGEMLVNIEYYDSSIHELKIDFDISACDYGTTEVAEFNPSDYGFVTYEEFIENSQDEEYYDEDFDFEEMISSFPSSIEIDGKVYETDYSYLLEY